MSTRTRTRRGSMWLALLVVLAVLAMLTPASAAPGYVVAPPGATVAGYLPKPVVLQKGNALKFLNLDTAPHDVRSTSGLFYSPVITIGKQKPVWGANLLKKGTYAFYCSIHPNMKGSLRVI